MEYYSHFYANSENKEFIKNYTGIVKYFCEDSNGERKYFSFSCTNATFTINDFGFIYWEDGIFVNGTWYNGIFCKGQFENGIWYNGIFGYNNLKNKENNIVWKNGYFLGGIFCGSVWQNGYFCEQQSNSKSYWFSDNVWTKGYINGVFSNKTPEKILINGNNFKDFSDNAYFFYVSEEDLEFYISIVSCCNSNFSIDNFGKITSQSGYFCGKFKNSNFSNSNIENSELDQCYKIANSTIKNSKIINCDCFNCQIFNSIVDNGVFQDVIFQQFCILRDIYFISGSIDNCNWYNGVFNLNKANICNWGQNNNWFSGIWNGGNINGKHSDIPPYIIGNGQSFQNYTGNILYKYSIPCSKPQKYQQYVVTVTNASIQFTALGDIFFSEGTWNDGSFANGKFFNGTWLNGNFNNGTFYNSVFYNGDFNNGSFDNSTFKNGNFNGGTFKHSIFYDGKFNDGNWITFGSFWINGLWVNGKQNSIIKNLKPNLRFIDQYKEYLSDNTKLLTGEFDYKVYNEETNNFEYYCIKVKDANFSIENGYIKWNRGTFVDGVWYNGQWNCLQNSELDFINFCDLQLLNCVQTCVWENGIWYNGNWNYQNSTWKNGTWIKGKINNIEYDKAPNFILGNNNQFENYTGNIIYYCMENSKLFFAQINVSNANLKIENDGYIIFTDGIFKNGYWHNGQWSGDIWQNGIWNDGIWKCGIWKNGQWKNGEWANNSYFQKINDSYLQQKKYGSYKTIGYKFIQTKNKPSIGFLIHQKNQQKTQNNINENNQYKIQGNEQVSLIQEKTWVDSVWQNGTFNNSNTSFAPTNQISNGKRFYNYSSDIVQYQYENNIYQFSCANATFSIGSEGKIYWQTGSFYGSNSIWRDGIWNAGQFSGTQWKNGTWNFGNFKSGIFLSGIWENGNFFENGNTQFLNGSWNKGNIIINGKSYYSDYSPKIKEGNNKLFLNYTGEIKYRDTKQYYKLKVSNAYFVILDKINTEDDADIYGFVVFYKGTIQDGQFSNGIFKTANYNTDYSYITTKEIELNKEYTFGKFSYEYKKDKQNYFKLNKEQILLFQDTSKYVSKFNDGTFLNGIWKNGQWVNGYWKNGQWITGIRSNIVMDYPPTYIQIQQTDVQVRFQNLSNGIEYDVIYFDESISDVVKKRQVFAVKNAYFKIKYIKTTKEKIQFNKTFIQWEDGQWISGYWSDGIWKKGNWIDGNWRIGSWINGYWYNGQWIDGMWYNGFFLGGKQNNVRIMNQVSK